MFISAGYHISYLFLEQKTRAEFNRLSGNSATIPVRDSGKLSTHINSISFPPREFYFALDMIASLVFITLSFLSFTGVLPHISIGGNIAMLTIGSINFIFSWFQETRKSSVTKDTNSIDQMIENRFNEVF